MIRYFLSISVILLFCFIPQSLQAGSFEDGLKLQQQQKFKEALAKFELAAEEKPRDPQVHNMLGMAYRMRFGQTGTAEFREKEIASFKKAIELDPKFWVAQKNLGVTLYYANRKPEAAVELKKALKLNPNDPEKETLTKWIKEGERK